MAFDAHDLDLNQLILCRNLLQDEVIHHIAHPADTPEEFRSEAAACAARLIHLAETRGLGGNLMRTYLLYLLVHEKNLAAQAVEEFAKDGQIGGSLLQAFIHDLSLLLPLLELPASTFLALPLLDDYSPTKMQGSEALSALQELTKDAHEAQDYAVALLTYYRCYGYGEIASYRAFRWDEKKKRLVGIRHFEGQRLSDLIGYAHQKDLLTGNTEAFVAGRPANNCLLVGARGTGKSSAVKALANEYYSQGLRLVQLTKRQLPSLPLLMETLRGFASKRFIIFLDDLSFEESDTEYKSLKSAIEGGVEARPENVLIYATSNRRHLIRETWRDRLDEQDELYKKDSMNETISLSDRFGLIIQYYAPNQEEYLAIIAHMLKKQGIELTAEDLRIEGLRWEMAHSGRSGRTAEQFVRHYLGKN
ncbi:MAG: ATP-binding protein [Selenomonas sp.]|nr:ATP-binding protein [Selenomonas sp.]